MGLPHRGSRPDDSFLKEIRKDPANDLIPVRLAFLILGHQYPATLVCINIYIFKNII